MSRLFYHTMQDNAGNLLFDVSGTMRIAGSGTLATIYGDEALTIIVPNPMTNHPSFGSFKCFLGAGDYDFYMAKAGYTFETLTGVQGHGTIAQQDASAVAITGGTITGLASLTTVNLLTTGQVNFNAGASATTYLVPNRVGNDQLAIQGDLSNVGTNRWNLYMTGGAPNYLSGPLCIGILNGTTYMLYCNGTAGIPGGLWTNSTSRAVLKQAIRAVEDPIAVLRALTPRQWRWADDQPALEATMPGTQAGFVVEEVAQVKPEWTPDRGDGTQDLAMRGLEAYLVAAVQQILTRLEALEARLAGTAP